MGNARQRGQAGIELVGVALALMLVALAGWQAILAAYAWQTAQSAARSGARAGSVGAPVERAALTVMPDRLAGRARVATVAAGEGATAVRVSVPVPWIIPGPGMGAVDARMEIAP
jgi:hypothetical protein